MIASISKRRNEALHMLDLYRAGLGKRVDEAMSEIIDVEHEVVDEPDRGREAPRLVPSTNPPQWRRRSSSRTRPQWRRRSPRIIPRKVRLTGWTRFRRQE